MARRPYTVDEKTIGRFDGRNTAFARARTDSALPFHGQGIHAHAGEIVARGEPGKTRVDFAELEAAWTASRHLGGYGADWMGEAPEPEVPRV